MAGARQWETIAGLVSERRKNGQNVLLVCSALSGVTDGLDELASPGSDISRIRGQILDQHQQLAQSLGIDIASLLEESAQLLDQKYNAFVDSPGPQTRADLHSLGEWMSSRLGAVYLSEREEASWVDSRSALEVIPEDDPDSQRAWLSARCETFRDEDLSNSWLGAGAVLITQGYVASTAEGETALLGRGGSDTSAALLASRLGAAEVEIWTDVPGLFSANPMRDPEALLIRELNYTEALEMAASGARVVHPRCIRAAADAGISLQLRDINRPQIEGTRITGSQSAVSEVAPAQGIKAVTSQDGMLVILMENKDIRQQVGFLAWAFGVFSSLGLSIDLVATSETTTTVAINDVDNHLDIDVIDSLSERLMERCKLRIYGDCCCVNLVGRGARTALSQLAPATAGFKEWPLLMLSQSANDMCLSMLVHPEHAGQLLSDLHRSLVLEGEMARKGDVYGPCWSELVKG